MSRVLQALGLSRKHLTLPAFKRPLRFLSHRGLIGEWLLRGIPIDEATQLGLDPSEQFTFWVYPDEGIGHFLYWYGFEGWEFHTVKLFADFARRARAIVDVGANTGVYSLLACTVNPTAQVIGFEPVPSTYQRLLRNIALNKFEGRCHTRTEALSNFIGSSSLEVPEDLTMARMVGNPTGNSIQVPVSTADALLPDDMPVDLVKIDVEGFEDKVLEGMQRTLRRWHPPIIFEVLPGGPAKAIEDVLRPLGYSFSCITENGPESVSNLDPGVATERNFLALAPNANV